MSGIAGGYGAGIKDPGNDLALVDTNLSWQELK
jgi:hypothetical protein